MNDHLELELRAPQRSRARSVKRLTAALVGAVLLLGVSAGAVSAQSSSESECDGETYAVVFARTPNR